MSISKPSIDFDLDLKASAVDLVYWARPDALVVPAAASGLKPDSAKQINSV